MNQDNSNKLTYTIILIFFSDTWTATGKIILYKNVLGETIKLILLNTDSWLCISGSTSVGHRKVLIGIRELILRVLPSKAPSYKSFKNLLPCNNIYLSVYLSAIYKMCAWLKRSSQNSCMFFWEFINVHYYHILIGKK